MRFPTLSLFLFGLLSAQTWAEEKTAPLPDEVVIGNETFMLIPEGWAYKSISQYDHLRDKYPLVRVWIDGFYMAKYEAKAVDFARFLNNAGEEPLRMVEQNPLHQSCVVQQDDAGSFFVDRPEPNIPASGLSWEQAVAFAQWMGFRLPSEAEWEKAARGPDDQRLWPWGNETPVRGEHAIFGMSAVAENDGCSKVVPVDQLPKGVSPYGIYNMAGNVREFVADHSPASDDLRARFHDWVKDGDRNPVQLEGPRRLLKGGRWADWDRAITASSRVVYDPVKTFRCNGVRFALDIDTVRQLIRSSQKEKAS